MVIEPKSETGLKFVSDPEEPGIKLGPENGFLMGSNWANRLKIVKSYKIAQKEFWAQEIKNTADRA